MSDANPIESFMAVTGASKEDAAKCLNMARGNLDAAVAAFFDSQEEDSESRTGGGREDADMSTDDVADVSLESSSSAVESILQSVKGAKGAGKGDAGGKGDGPPDNAKMVAIVFFSDGFMVDDEPEPLKDPEPAPEEPAAPAPRRTGMMGLNDLKPSRGRKGPRPKLPKLKPLRSYDTPGNKEFLDQVKAGRLPKELQKRDEAGKPIPVSIGLEDVRPKSYAELSEAIKQMEKEEEEEKGGSQAPPAPTLFTGAGHTLSAGSSSGSGAGAAPASRAGAGSGSGSGAAPALLSLLSSGEPTVDESKPVTTIQLRLSTGSRARVRLNLDHTVADLWRSVAAQMGLDAFRAASNHELSAGFPPKPLSDPGVTIKAADLANAAVTHRCS